MENFFQNNKTLNRICKFPVSPNCAFSAGGHYSKMKLPSFFNRKNGVEKESAESTVNSEASCILCSPRSENKTAKLLIVTGQWNFYYCYRCRQWFQAHFSSKEIVLPIRNQKIQTSLTWFWRSENELYEENRRAMMWFRSLFTGRRYEDRMI